MARNTNAAGRQIAGATLMLTLSNAGVRLISIVTMPILTRLLPAQAYGGAALAGTLISLLAVIFLAGMDMSYARSYFAAEGPSGRQVEVFAWRYTLLAASLAGLCGALLWYWLAPYYGLSRGLAGLVGGGAFLSFVQTMAQVRARLHGRYRAMMLTGLVSALAIATVGIGIAAWWRKDAVAVLASMLAGYFAVVVVLGIPSPRRLAERSGLSPSQRSAIIRVGLAGIVTAPMYWVLASLDRWFLGGMMNTSAVGIYSMGYNLATVGLMVSTAVASVWLPEAARLFEAAPEAAPVALGVIAERLVVVQAVVWVAVAGAGGDILRLLAAKPFHAAAPVIPFIAAGVFFNGVAQVASSLILLARRLQQAVPWWAIGTAVCCAGNVLLIPRMGIVGAAVTQAIAFGIVAGGIWVSAQRALHLQFHAWRTGLCLLVLLGGGAAMSPAWSAMPLVSLLAKFPVGVALAAIAGFWMAPQDFRAMLSGAGRRLAGMSVRKGKA